MDIEALASLESQKRFCNELVEMAVKEESFILLSGETGSGRTVVCEQLVNETDAKMRAVFIPCHKDMQIQRLRELFLQQLIPSGKYDYDLNLPDILSSVHIPYNHKILVVVDDIDTVVSSFYNELLALHQQFAGQGRFSFVLVCQPLWADEKAARPVGNVDVSVMEIPALSLKEAGILSRHLFAVQNAMRIYNSIKNKLPEALSNADGNMSKIIAITEKLMKDPTSPQVSNDRMRKAGKDAAAKPKKKSSSVGIFVTVVCIVIVFACLIPIFFGGSFFGSDDSGKSATKSQVANGDALVFNDDEKLQADGGLLPDAVPGGVDAEIVKKETEHSVTLSGKELEQIEGGANNSGYPRGVGGSVNQATAQVPVLRRSDNFNHIKAGSGLATTAIDVPPVSQMTGPVPQQMPQQMAQQRPQQMAQQMPQQLAQPQVAPKPMVPPQNQVAQSIARDTAALEAAAQKKLKADREAAAKAQAQAQAQANAQNQTAQAQKPAAPAAPKPVVPQRQPLKAGQVISLADEQRQLKQLQAAQAQASRPAAQNTAASAESKAKIGALNGNHWTVQIVSASNRANVAAAARGLTTPWWIVDSSRNGRPWYILISGDYATREEAIAASRNIPLSVSQGATPFAKRISEAKAELR
ncbi:MAG: AAA family ATPase [Anaerobiospirillum succiniciproducens]|uniref:AAA family ATPase n=1 Tax=Anaerobiospirillum succiniciproducens TaxID=13335 RepID=UPI0026DC2D3E|nr:AAA family ATPase [Anaerobiospirillum succiniciproducens]MDO4675801.1 AAA family ATPase [Anaerobiospirillum succiniciproducens]